MSFKSLHLSPANFHIWISVLLDTLFNPALLDSLAQSCETLMRQFIHLKLFTKCLPCARICPRHSGFRMEQMWRMPSRSLVSTEKGKCGISFILTKLNAMPCGRPEELVMASQDMETLEVHLSGCSFLAVWREYNLWREKNHRCSHSQLHCHVLFVYHKYYFPSIKRVNISECFLYVHMSSSFHITSLSWFLYWSVLSLRLMLKPIQTDLGKRGHL